MQNDNRFSDNIPQVDSHVITIFSTKTAVWVLYQAIPGYLILRLTYLSTIPFFFEPIWKKQLKKETFTKLQPVSSPSSVFSPSQSVFDRSNGVGTWQSVSTWLRLLHPAAAGSRDTPGHCASAAVWLGGRQVPPTDPPWDRRRTMVPCECLERSEEKLSSWDGCFCDDPCAPKNTSSWKFDAKKDKSKKSAVWLPTCCILNLGSSWLLLWLFMAWKLSPFRAMTKLLGPLYLRHNHSPLKMCNPSSWPHGVPCDSVLWRHDCNSSSFQVQKQVWTSKPGPPPQPPTHILGTPKELGRCSSQKPTGPLAEVLVGWCSDHGGLYDNPQYPE